MSESINLIVNQEAPIFNLVDIFGRRIDLKAYRGKKLLVGFFRHAGCPFCNVRVHNLQRRSIDLKAKGLEMIFFFESTEVTLKKHKFHIDVNPIPLIADPDKTWYDKYGIENSRLKSAISHVTSIFQTAIKAKIKGLPVHTMEGRESISTIPAEFLIDENGIVKVVHYARSLADRMKMETIYDFVEALLVNLLKKRQARYLGVSIHDQLLTHLISHSRRFFSLNKVSAGLSQQSENIHNRFTFGFRLLP